MANLWGAVQSTVNNAKKKWAEVTITKLKEGTPDERRGLDVVNQASEEHIGEIGGSSIQVSATIATTAEAYNGSPTAPVCVGVPVRLQGALRKANGTGVLQSLTLFETANSLANLQKASGIVLLFRTQPTNGVYANKQGPSYGTDKPLRAIPINSSDYNYIGDNKAMVDLSPGGRMLTGDGNGDLWALFLTTQAASYASANSLTLAIGDMRD